MSGGNVAADAELLENRILSEKEIGEQALAALVSEAGRQGISVPQPEWQAAQFSLQRDPFSGEESLHARWAGRQRGLLTLRPEGWVYGELDVCAAHPSKPGQWIEAVTTWGKAPQLKAEARLIELPQ